MNGRNISDEVEEETGSAGPGYTSQDSVADDLSLGRSGSTAGNTGDAAADGQYNPPTGGLSQYIPSDTDRRRDTVYMAINSAGGQPISADEIVQRAATIDDYICNGSSDVKAGAAK